MNDAALILFNLFVCSAGGIICICRMSKMSHTETKLEIRWQYAIWFSLFTASGWSFLFGDRADFVQLGLSAGILIHLMIGIPVWKDSPPEYSRERREVTRRVGRASNIGA